MNYLHVAALPDRRGWVISAYFFSSSPSVPVIYAMKPEKSAALQSRMYVSRGRQCEIRRAARLASGSLPEDLTHLSIGYSRPSEPVNQLGLLPTHVCWYRGPGRSSSCPGRGQDGRVRRTIANPMRARGSAAPRRKIWGISPCGRGSVSAAATRSAAESGLLRSRNPHRLIHSGGLYYKSGPSRVGICAARAPHTGACPMYVVCMYVHISYTPTGSGVHSPSFAARA